MTTYETVEYTLENGVALVRLNQPESLNAMSMAMGRDLLAAIKQAATEARALVIGGNGRAFSAGANLHTLAFELDDPERDIGISLETTFNPMIEIIRDYPIPIITAVKGAAAGVGCSPPCHRCRLAWPRGPDPRCCGRRQIDTGAGIDRSRCDAGGR